jgi:hypothetical protein
MRRGLLAMLDVKEAANTPPGMEIGAPGRGRKGRASYLGRDREHPLRVTVTPAEKVQIEARAKEAGLSVASYLRACALGKQVHSVLDLRAVSELVKVAGDQGRLGGLLKLWLVDQPGRGAPEIEVRRLLDRIGDAQGALAEIVSRV